MGLTLGSGSGSGSGTGSILSCFDEDGFLSLKMLSKREERLVLAVDL